jgi:hypothetical protein
MKTFFAILIFSMGIAAPAYAHSVSIAWDASTSSDVNYFIYRGTKSGGPYTKLNSTAQSTLSYSDSSVLAGSTYYYVTTSVNSKNVESSYSNQISVSIPSATPIPTPSPTPKPAFSLNEQVKIANVVPPATAFIWSAPSTTTGTIVGPESLGALGTIIGGPSASTPQGIWWEIKFDNGVTGWDTQPYLTPAPKPTPTPTPTPSPTPKPAFSLNEQVKIANVVSPATAFIWSSPSTTTGTIVGPESLGALGTIIGGPSASTPQGIWWEIKFDNGVTGWDTQPYLAPAP